MTLWHNCCGFEFVSIWFLSMYMTVKQRDWSHFFWCPCLSLFCLWCCFNCISWIFLYCTYMISNWVCLDDRMMA